MVEHRPRLSTPRAVLSAMDYLHKNPVRRRRVTGPADWEWLSAQCDVGDPPRKEADVPRLQPVPPEWFPTVNPTAGQVSSGHPFEAVTVGDTSASSVFGGVHILV